VELTNSVELSTTESPPVEHQLDSFPAFYGTLRSITTFTRALQLYLSWSRPIQSMPHHPIYPWSILMLFTHLHPGLPSSLSPLGFPTNNLHAFLFSPIRAICPAHLFLLGLINLILLAEEFKLWNSQLCSFSNLPSRHPSSAKIFSSASHSQTPSVYILPLKSLNCGIIYKSFSPWQKTNPHTF
jgi:hypothetical protein